MGIRDENGQIKTWVWIVGAVGAVALIAFVLRGRSATSEAPFVEGQSSDITEQLSAIADLLKDLQEDRDNAGSGDGNGNGNGGDEDKAPSPKDDPLPNLKVPFDPKTPGIPFPIVPKPKITPMPIGTAPPPISTPMGQLPSARNAPSVPRTLAPLGFGMGNSNIPSSVGRLPRVNPTDAGS